MPAGDKTSQCESFGSSGCAVLPAVNLFCHCDSTGSEVGVLILPVPLPVGHPGPTWGLFRASNRPLRDRCEWTDFLESPGCHHLHTLLVTPAYHQHGRLLFADSEVRVIACCNVVGGGGPECEEDGGCWAIASCGWRCTATPLSARTCTSCTPLLLHCILDYSRQDPTRWRWMLCYRMNVICLVTACSIVAIHPLTLLNTDQFGFIIWLPTPFWPLCSKNTMGSFDQRLWRQYHNERPASSQAYRFFNQTDTTGVIATCWFF